MNEIETIRIRLHHALADGRPQEEILQVSRCLDAMIVAGMRANLHNTCPATCNGTGTGCARGTLR